MPKYTLPITTFARKTCEQMTFAEKIREICCGHFDSHYVPENLVPAGAAFFFPATAENLQKAIVQFQEICDRPPLLCTDLEFGAGLFIKGATEFPSLFAAGEAGEDAAYVMGKHAALEGGAIGYNWTFAPTVDLNLNADCPSTSYRAAGHDPDRVIATATAYLKGVQEQGMLATAKHFPGDGLCIYDQHLTTPPMPLAVDQWRETYGKVYRKVIDAGVATVMPGHISFPAYDQPSPVNGLYPPATLSNNLMTNLLKQELGFEGLIVSDAVEMGGFAGFMNYYDALALFLKAGGDVLLFVNPVPRFIEEMEKRLESGMLSEETVDNRVQRVLSQKEKMGLTGPDAITRPVPEPIELSNKSEAGAIEDAETGGTSQDADAPASRKSKLRSPEARASARKMISSALRLLRDRKGYLPICEPEKKSVLHVGILGGYTENGWVCDGMVNYMKERFSSVSALVDPGPFRLVQEVESNEHDLVIASIISDYNFGTNQIRLAGLTARNMMSGWMHRGVPVIFILHFHPYTHLEYEAAMDCVVRTGGTVDQTFSLLMDFLMQPGPEIRPDERDIRIAQL